MDLGDPGYPRMPRGLADVDFGLLPLQHWRLNMIEGVVPMHFSPIKSFDFGVCFHYITPFKIVFLDV